VPLEDDEEDIEAGSVYGESVYGESRKESVVSGRAGHQSGGFAIRVSNFVPQAQPGQMLRRTSAAVKHRGFVQGDMDLISISEQEHDLLQSPKFSSPRRSVYTSPRKAVKKRANSSGGGSGTFTSSQASASHDGAFSSPRKTGQKISSNLTEIPFL
jgi:hypothetical protein